MASPALHHAIHHAHLERLQSVLLSLCNASPIALDLLERKLLMDEESASGDESKEKRTVLDVTALTEKKRQRSRYITCKNCHEEFDLANNKERGCKTHYGILEPVEDEWPDHDEDCHGPIETQENLEEYPEKFRWDCCEGSGNAEGCKAGIHYEDADFKPTTKKRRLLPSYE